MKGSDAAGSERAAHLVEAYGVSAAAFPASCHYVALGHLHRPGRARSCPIEYPGSPLQLDFGEAGEAKSAVVVDAAVGTPATTTLVPLTSGRPLVEVPDPGRTDHRGRWAPAGDDAFLKVRVRDTQRVGLAGRGAGAVPGCRRRRGRSTGPGRRRRAHRRRLDGRSPSELFGAYLADQGVDDPRLSALFDELLEEVTSP